MNLNIIEPRQSRAVCECVCVCTCDAPSEEYLSAREYYEGLVAIGSVDGARTLSV